MSNSLETRTPARLRRGVFALLLLLGTSAAPAEPTGDATGLRLGSVAMDIPAVMHQRLKPLTDYLSAELGQPVALRLSPDLASTAASVASGEVEIAYLTPMAYLKAREQGGVRLVAKTVTRGQRSFRLMIVTRRDSPIRAVAELAGRRFAFGDRAAVLQRAVVVHAGLPLERLGAYHFLGHYDNIARGVASGDFDAGILKDTSAYEWEKKGLRILHASPELPPYNIVVSRTVSDALYRSIRRAFLQLDPANPKRLRAIKTLDESYDGFAPAADADYDVVRRLVLPFNDET